MSYTKTNWTKGDVITAEKLNKMEDGIEQAGSGGVRIINLNELERVTPISGEEDSNAGFQYEIGLSAKNFIGSVLASGSASDILNYNPITALSSENSTVTLMFRNVSTIYHYYPSSGHITFTSSSPK